MPSDFLAVRIETFGLVELTESGVNTSIPGPPLDLHAEPYGGEPKVSCVLLAKTLSTQWIERPIGGTVWPSE